MLKRIIAPLALLVALTGGLLVTTAGPASAAYTDCTAGQSCLWGAENGFGTPVVKAASVYNDGACHNLNIHPTGGFHSAKGNYGSGLTFVVYTGTGCSGGSYWLTGGATKSLTTLSGLTFNSFEIV